ncbi:MAG TPA: amino acid ABC transporter permease [Caldimonas sp.]|jgi:general L-amino acid transport system permease protein|nr:amino acid ABC transporter permease [Caldimonas sp.]
MSDGTSALAVPGRSLVDVARRRFFYGPGASIVTIAVAALLAWLGWLALDWAVLRAVTQPDYAACKLPGRGACWGFVAEKWRLIVFGRYPYEEQWRPALATATVVAMLVASALPALWTKRGARGLAAGWIAALAIFFFLMFGGALGLGVVGTERWGGLPLTVILTLIGIGASAPIGVLLALARRSQLPLLRSLATAYIELVRGVPLLTVLFVATFVLPLVLPPGWRIDPFWRVAIGLVLFQAAYMAETVRGGLQTLPRGQLDAGTSLGLRYWQLQRAVVMPQALVAVIPVFVNNLLSTFMDTSLVTVVSMYDLTGSLRLALGDPRWRDFFIEGYLFIASIYFGASFAMSRYSQWLERRLKIDFAR